MPLSRRIPTMAEISATRPRAVPKPGPSVLRRKAVKAEQKSREEKFKDAVWLRDEGRSRASMKPVLRGHLDPTKRGEVAHLKPRSTAPEKKYLRKNGVLLTAEEHALSDARTAGGTVLLDIVGTNADKELTFIRRDQQTGRELWRHTS